MKSRATTLNELGIIEVTLYWIVVAYWPAQAASLSSCKPGCGYSFPDYTLLHYHSMGGASFCINLCGMPFLLDNEEAGPMYEL